MITTVFLDIDGILTTVDSTYDENGIVFTPRAVYWLNKFFAAVHCEIVISSTWRESYSLRELRDELSNLKAKIKSTTPIIGHRGVEIATWLKENACDNYIVIDDIIDEILQYIPENKIVHVHDGFNKNGFAEIHYKIAMKISKRNSDLL